VSLPDRLAYRPAGGQFRECYGVTTAVEPQDLSLYRRLLPAPLEVPPRPIVTIYVVDFLRVAPWPLTPYQEWSVLLKCSHSGEEGWFPLTMPVTKWVPMKGGRRIGYPKWVADLITVEAQGERVVATGTHRGARQVELEFNPGLSRPLADWERELLEDESFFKGPQNFQFVPPGRGPRLLKITLEHAVEAHWSPRSGMVRVQAAAHEDWSGLVAEAPESPGTVNHFVGGMNLVWEEASSCT
jgi:hypothetical protein